MPGGMSPGTAGCGVVATGPLPSNSLTGESPQERLGRPRPAQLGLQVLYSATPLWRVPHAKMCCNLHERRILCNSLPWAEHNLLVVSRA